MLGSTYAHYLDRVETFVGMLRWGTFLPMGPPYVGSLAFDADQPLFVSFSANPDHGLQQITPGYYMYWKQSASQAQEFEFPPNDDRFYFSSIFRDLRNIK